MTDDILQTTSGEATTQHHHDDTTAATHTDFFHGDVEGGLERMRRRLLDLTKKNRLLNYRYAKKGALRVVDELPDPLFQHLIDGRELFFRPVPRPPGWRSRGAQLDALPGTQPVSAEQHAKALGIRTSYDLPERSELGQDLEARHADRAIQTLHYPDDLESLLRKLASTARLTIEETGTNMLYLVFGFLEWYESEESEQAALAPLVLVPVSLRRADPDARTRTYRYAVHYSGEDILANISLQELLKRDFSLDLPEFDEEDTPESYFEKLEPLLARQPRWKLRRHITLTLLSFGKLLMYRDLDPATWPQGKGPAQHPRIREFFEGRQQEGVEYATEYWLDDPAIRAAVPYLVDEADSSQHSALVDAVAGKNLVISGPPGTGKSQTITNLIAAALAAGKRVLFVSEKLAALEVVRHRLERLGLGTFCLELHSHKSNKRALLDDIEARMKKQGSFGDPALLDDRLKALEDTKRQLSEYAGLMNRPFGAFHQKLFDVIWAASRAKAAIGPAAAVLSQQRLRNAASTTPHEFDALQQAVARYAKHFAAITYPTLPLQAHPWYGLRNPDLTFPDETIVCGSLRFAVDAIESLLRAISDVHTLLDGGEWILPRIKSLASAKRVIDGLPDPEGSIGELLPKLDRTGAAKRMAEFTAWLETWQRLSREIRRDFGDLPLYDADTIQSIASQLERAASLAPAVQTVGEVGDTAALAADAATALLDAARIPEELRVLVGISVDGADGTVALLNAVLEAIATCPVQYLHLRHDGLRAAGAVQTLDTADRSAAAIRERIARMAKRLDLAMLPTPSELRAHTLATKDPNWWRFLIGEYRKAKRAYRVMSRASRVTVAEMHRDFRELLDIETARAAIAANGDFARCAGAYFKGIDSPFAELRALASWRERLRGLLLPFGDDGETISEHIWSAPSELLSAFVGVEASHRSRKMRLTSAAEHLQRLREATGSPALTAPDWHANAAALAALSTQLAEVDEALRRAPIPATVRISARERLVAAIRDRAVLHKRIEQAVEARELLGAHFHGIATELGPLLSTLAYYRGVGEAELPRHVRNWLLQPDAVQRLGAVRQHLSQAALLSDAVERSWSDFERLAQLNFAEWSGSHSPFEATKLDRLTERCVSALGRPHTLAEWLDYIHSAAELRNGDLGYLVDLAEDGRLPPTHLGQALEFVRANSVVEEAFQAHPPLAHFSGLSHEQVRARYAELDRECIQLYRQRAAALISRRKIPAGVGYGPASAYTERHLIEREIAKQRRHIPLRQLMRRAGNALQALKPCFMMGPLSVAQYLPPGAIELDLLIVDEASQLRPQDALGAIARVQQVVIVGDQMQLPPTSFFDRLDDSEEEEEEESSAIEDSESILDVASSLYRPARMLRWHYRSRHGSLIAYSNKEFYKNELVVFPSPVPRSKALGVKFIHVPDGRFENRRNITEAKRIVAAALRHMEQRPSETLGIVAMNAPQRELLEEMLEQELKRHPAGERFARAPEHGLEPLFVKNLENVQGDERDVIYISVTYGKNPQGQLVQRFGPLVGATGHRRLNVLFTRARKRVVVFSSMAADEIRIPPDSAWGLRALKGYLAYAQSGILETALFSGRDPDSDFEVEVATALQERGLDVVAQVGVAGYYLDLAVRHPDKRDAFILGIECDGATYHSSRSARDRDRLRQDVLENLGWRIHRVWSTDWFKQRTREIDRILEHVEHLRREPVDVSIETDWLDTFEPPPSTTPDEDEDWLSEVEAQPLTAQQALEQLQQLRTSIASTDGSIEAQDSLLRPAMIEALLKAKPRTHDDWLRAVPLELRLDTNGGHVSKYLANVLEITGRLAR